MRDVSKLKFIGSSFCTQYQSQAQFYIDETHASGLRHLVENGDPDLLTGIPAEGGHPPPATTPLTSGSSIMPSFST